MLGVLLEDEVRGLQALLVLLRLVELDDVLEGLGLFFGEALLVGLRGAAMVPCYPFLLMACDACVRALAGVRAAPKTDMAPRARC